MIFQSAEHSKSSSTELEEDKNKKIYGTDEIWANNSTPKSQTVQCELLLISISQYVTYSKRE
jgi:hypothetical protein